MKTLLLRLSRLGLIALLALTTTARSTAAEKSKPTGASANFELSWTHPSTPMVQAARTKLQRYEQLEQKGGALKEDVAQMRLEFEDVERHTPYALTLLSRGETLREFIATMAAAEEVSMTVINAGEPADLETPLPPFNLRNANWGTVIEVLANFLATRGLQLKLAGSEAPDLLASKSVVCVLRRVESAAPNRIEPTHFESFPVAQYLTEQSIDDIVSAIRTGWELDPAHERDALRIKFHPATSILLVSGPPMATNIAGKIISQLKRAPTKVPPAPSPAPAPAPANKE